jgi:hypothetical protein
MTFFMSVDESHWLQTTTLSMLQNVKSFVVFPVFVYEHKVAERALISLLIEFVQAGVSTVALCFWNVVPLFAIFDARVNSLLWTNADLCAGAWRYAEVPVVLAGACLLHES